MKTAAVILLFISLYAFGSSDPDSQCGTHNKTSLYSGSNSYANFLQDLTSINNDQLIIQGPGDEEGDNQILGVEDDEDEIETCTRKNFLSERSISSILQVLFAGLFNKGLIAHASFLKPHIPLVSCLYLTQNVFRI